MPKNNKNGWAQLIGAGLAYAAQRDANRNNQDRPVNTDTRSTGYNEQYQDDTNISIGGSQNEEDYYENTWRGSEATRGMAEEFGRAALDQFRAGSFPRGGKGPGGGGGGGRGGGGGGRPGRNGGRGSWESQAGKLGQGIVDMADDPVPGLDSANAYNEAVFGAGGGNEIDTELRQKLAGANFDDPARMMEDFANGGYGNDPFGGLTGWNGYDPRATSSPGWNEAGGEYGSGGGYGRGSQPIVGDEMAGDGFFQQQTRALFDPSRLDPANDPTMAPYLDALRKRNQEALDAQLQDVGDEAAGAGMYGGSALALERATARTKAIDDLTAQEAGVLFGSRKEALDRQMEGLGMVNTRDMTGAEIANRERSDKERNAWESRENALDRELDARDMQARLQYDARGQNLTALQDLTNWHGQGLDRLGEASGRLDDRRSGARDSLSGLNDLRYDPKERGLAVAERFAQRDEERRRWAAGARDRQMDRFQDRLNFLAGLEGGTAGGSSSSNLDAQVDVGSSSGAGYSDNLDQTRPGSGSINTRPPGSPPPAAAAQAKSARTRRAAQRRRR